MSKPDPTGESLESILASIRKSLSEQSTGVLEEEAAPPADAPKGAISGLARRLAESDDAAPLVLGDPPPLFGEDAASAEAFPVEPLPELPSLPGNPPPIVPLPAQAMAEAASPSAAPPQKEPQKDALWFLGMRGPQAAPESVPPPPIDAPSRPADPVPQPSRSARPGVVRGPLPPFFGSSAEAQKAEVVLVQPSSPGGSMLPPTPQPAKAVVNGQAGPPLGPAGPANPAPAAMQADGQRNGAASSLFGPVASDAKIAGSAGPHTHALEAMVAEMLRPMLQRWLDENMPRLVAAALKDEAMRMAVRDQNKV